VLFGLLVCVCPAAVFAQNIEKGALATRYFGNGSRYAFRDSQGRPWTYVGNSQGGYDVFNGDHEPVAYVTATYE